MSNKRAIFFISDRTGITAENLGHSLLTQFPDTDFDQYTLAFIDTSEKAKEAVAQVNKAAKESGMRPIIFSTMVNPEIRKVIMSGPAVVIDLFDTFLESLEDELHMKSLQMIGTYHGQVYDTISDARIDAMNYAMISDDGMYTKDYDKADVILIGVSRAGKTPTCLYLGLQYGIYAANYPLTEEDLFIEYNKIPGVLHPFRDKLFGLSINPERLQRIREARRPNSRYASLQTCRQEVSMAENLFLSKNIPYINVSTLSVEEIAATILHKTKIQRRIF